MGHSQWQGLTKEIVKWTVLMARHCRSFIYSNPQLAVSRCCQIFLLRRWHICILRCYQWGACKATLPSRYACWAHHRNLIGREKATAESAEIEGWKKRGRDARPWEKKRIVIPWKGSLMSIRLSEEPFQSDLTTLSTSFNQPSKFCKIFFSSQRGDERTK